MRDIQQLCCKLEKNRYKARDSTGRRSIYAVFALSSGFLTKRAAFRSRSRNIWIHASRKRGDRAVPRNEPSKASLDCEQLKIKRPFEWRSSRLLAEFSRKPGGRSPDSLTRSQWTHVGWMYDEASELESRRGRPRESSGTAERVVGDGRESRRGRPRESSGTAERVVGDGRESRRGRPRESSGTAERVVGDGRESRRGRPRESSGESSRCAAEWPGESSGTAGRVVGDGQMYGSASSRPRDRTQADGAVSHLELERSCGSIPAGLRGGTSHQVLTRLSPAARAELDGLRPGMDNVAPSSGADGRGLRPNKNYCPLRLWSLRPTKNTTSSRATTGIASRFLSAFPLSVPSVAQTGPSPLRSELTRASTGQFPRSAGSVLVEKHSGEHCIFPLRVL